MIHTSTPTEEYFLQVTILSVGVNVAFMPHVCTHLCLLEETKMPHVQCRKKYGPVKGKGLLFMINRWWGYNC